MGVLNSEMASLKHGTSPQNAGPFCSAQQPAVTLFSTGLIGLGIIALINKDFAMVWQPVPDWVPGRHALALASGLAMLLIGIGVLFRTTATWSARILLPYLVAWALLKVPAVVVAPQIEAVWLGLGELTMLLAGGWILFCRLVPLKENSALAFLAGKRGIRMAKILFGISMIPVGLSHLVYVEATRGFVPAWLPFRAGWGCLTGAGHIAAGLGILFGVLDWLAATAEATMLGLFALLVWLPKILAAPKDRLSWTGFLITWIIAAAACAVAQNIPRKKA